VAFIREARARGYRVELRYVGLESPVLCAVRIAERVAKGGHDVPAPDVFRRFERSLANLTAILSDADESFLYDNSTSAGITLIARFAGAALLECAPEVPRWMERALESLLRR
jgi:predicted ABC-type ATPase